METQLARQLATRPGAARTAPGRLWADRIAGWLVTAGGLTIIASILGILLFIVIEIAPLFGGARVTERLRVDLGPAEARAVLTDEHLSHAALLTPDGIVRVVELPGGRTVLERSLLPADGPPTRLTGVAPVPGRSLLAAATDDGRVLAVPLRWEVSFRGSERVVAPHVEDPVVFEVDPQRRPLGAFAVRVEETGDGLAVARLADGRLAFVRHEVRVHPFTRERSETWTRAEAEAPADLTVLQLDDDRQNLFAGTAAGDLVWWPLLDGRPAAPGSPTPERRP